MGTKLPDFCYIKNPFGEGRLPDVTKGDNPRCQRKEIEMKKSPLSRKGSEATVARGPKSTAYQKGSVGKKLGQVVGGMATKALKDAGALKPEKKTSVQPNDANKKPPVKTESPNTKRYVHEPAPDSPVWHWMQ